MTSWHCTLLWRDYDCTVKPGGFLTSVVTEAEVILDVICPILRPSPLAPVPYQAFTQWATDVYACLQAGTPVHLQDCPTQCLQLLTHMLLLTTPTTLDQYHSQTQQFTQLAATFGAASSHPQPCGGNAMMLVTDCHHTWSPVYQSPTPPEAYCLQQAVTQRHQQDMKSQLMLDHYHNPQREERFQEPLQAR